MVHAAEGGRPRVRIELADGSAAVLDAVNEEACHRPSHHSETVALVHLLFILASVTSQVRDMWIVTLQQAVRDAKAHSRDCIRSCLFIPEVLSPTKAATRKPSSGGVTLEMSAMEYSEQPSQKDHLKIATAIIRANQAK